MERRALTGLILASTLVTLDGTAATIALPAIGRDLSVPVSRIQWIGNAPLVMLAALLLPAGAIGDRYGRVRVTRAGVAMFTAASLACVAAASDLWLIVARGAQGAGGALVLPAVLAVLRAAYADAAERTRTFGVWAAWTGAASAAGPLIGGALVDLLSWRAVFAMSAAAGVVAFVLLRAEVPVQTGARPQQVPVLATVAIVTLLGALAYLFIEAPDAGWRSAPVVLGAGLAAGGLLLLKAAPKRHILFPRELLGSHNCLPANGATFALYFGMFGLSFLLVLYTQQVLDYSAVRAALALLPVSAMLFLAEPFGRLAAKFGTRRVILAGGLVAGAGILWLATGGHPLPFWSRIVAGTAAFGLGVSLAVSALTQAAVSAVPEPCAGAASGLNHAVVRAAGLAAIALLGSVAARGGGADAVSPEGFQQAMLLCGVVVVGGSSVSAALVRDEKAGGLRQAA